jgi:hypothetical protein
MEADAQRAEALGPAERLIGTITAHVDHAMHNRPGLITQDARHAGGARWEQATWLAEDGEKVVYRVFKKGKKTDRTRVGVMNGTGEVMENGRVVGRFQSPGLFPEVVAHLYKQIAEVWKMDNEFAARWASWAYNHEDSRDLKVLLAAFMLVQNRYGEVIQDGEIKFLDDDYREVGEAMCLIRSKRKGGTFSPKLLLRVGEVLELPAVAQINRELGFGLSARNAPLGRYPKVIEKWLGHLEANAKILELLLKDGHRKGIMALCREIGYKPGTDKFFEALRWKQVQSKNGHRTVAIGKAVEKADTWEGLSEAEIGEKITKERPNWKVIAGKLPADMGITPAIMAAAIQAGSLSDADLIIMTPTLEELGLLTNAAIEKRWKAAIDKAENQRATNIAKNVKTAKAKEGLEEASDKAAAKAVEEVTKDMRIYVVVDKSGSMQGAIDQAKVYLKKFVGAFPLDRLHVAIFNTYGQEVEIKAQSAAAVEQAFRGHTSGGGTSYASGVGCLVNRYKPAENEDSIIIFVGDQQDNGWQQLVHIIQQSGVNPMAFGLLHIQSPFWGGQGNIVEYSAAVLGIPCLPIDEKIFEDPYAVPRTMRNLIAATPVNQAMPAGPTPRRRVTLVDQILKTELLKKPAWA